MSNFKFIAWSFDSWSNNSYVLFLFVKSTNFFKISKMMILIFDLFLIFAKTKSICVRRSICTLFMFFFVTNDSYEHASRKCFIVYRFEIESILIKTFKTFEINFQLFWSFYIIFESILCLQNILSKNFNRFQTHKIDAMIYFIEKRYLIFASLYCKHYELNIYEFIEIFISFHIIFAFFIRFIQHYF